MKATLSVLGLYNFDNTIFDDWTLPQGVNLETLKELIFQECAELCLTLPNPQLFKKATKAWTQRKQKGWTRALAAMDAEYNPIHNFDRMEEYTDAETGSSGTDTSSRGTTTNQVAGFNSSNYGPESQQSMTQSGDSDTTFGRELEHEAHLYGNIGVTTSQQMVTAEMELAGKLDIYQVITDDFKREFTLLIY